MNININTKQLNNTVEEFLKETNWRELSAFKYLSSSFIKKHWIDNCCQNNYIYIPELVKNQCEISERVLEGLVDVINTFPVSLDVPFRFWSNLSYQKYVSERFLDKYIKNINTNSISEFRNLSFKFIEKHSNILSWERLSSNIFIVNKDFVEKFKSKIDWKSLFYVCSRDMNFRCNDVIFDNNFMKTYYNYMPWREISRNHRLSNDTIDMFKDDIDFYLINRKLMTKAFTLKYLNYFSNEKISTSNWLDTDFFRNHYNKIDLDKVSWLEILNNLEADLIITHWNRIIKKLQYGDYIERYIPISKVLEINNKINLDIISICKCRVHSIDDVKMILPLIKPEYFSDREFRKEVEELLENYGELIV